MNKVKRFYHSKCDTPSSRISKASVRNQ